MQDFSSNQVILLGYSGHGLVVAEAAIVDKKHIIGYVDKTITKNNVYQLDYLGYENDPNAKMWLVEGAFVLGIGDNYIRHSVANMLRSKERNIAKVLHPQASISKYADIGQGVFIARNASINPDVVIERDSIINTGAIIEHGCKVGIAAHIAPGAVLAGNVSIGSNSLVGANSVIKQGVHVGSGVTIGMGSVIISDVPDNEIWYGNPAKKAK